VGVVFVVSPDPPDQRLFELFDGETFPRPDQIFLQGADDAFAVGIAFGVVIAGENLLDRFRYAQIRQYPQVR